MFFPLAPSWKFQSPYPHSTLQKVTKVLDLYIELLQCLGSHPVFQNNKPDITVIFLRLGRVTCLNHFGRISEDKKKVDNLSFP